MPRRHRAAVLVPLLAAVLASAGCAGTPGDEHTSVASSAPSAPTAVASTVAFDGDCSSVLTTDEAVRIVGHAVDLLDRSTPWDPAVIGGVRCQWGADGMPELTVAAYPESVVPRGILDAEKAECGNGWPCEGSDVFGALWVIANGSTEREVVDALDTVGKRASALAAPAPIASGARWEVPTCDELEPVIAGALGTDLQSRAPAEDPGLQWRILVETGAAASCEWSANGEKGYEDQIAVALAPGTSTLPPSGTAITVDGAQAAIYIAAVAPQRSSVMATTGRDVVGVSGRFHDDSDLVPLAAAVLAFMQTR